MPIVGPANLVEIYLGKHEVACKYHRLERVKPSGLDSHNEIAHLWIFDQAQALDQSLIVKSSIMNSGEKTVSVEVIEFIGVDLPRENLFQKQHVRLDILCREEACDVLSRDSVLFLEFVDQGSNRLGEHESSGN